MVAKECGSLQTEGMSADIHPTALVSDDADVGAGVSVGPFSIVEAGAVLGDKVTLHDRVTVKATTRLSEGVTVHSGAVLGGAPQILGMDPASIGTLTVGAGTIIRENVTFHAGSDGAESCVGVNCLFMANSHIGHDTRVGDRCVIANNVAIAGHCRIGDQVWFGGQSACHQQTWVGDHAMVGGGAALVGDLIPYGMAIGNQAKLEGLNLVGLKRRGFERVAINALRAAFKMIFLGEGDFDSRVAETETRFADSPDVMKMIAFIRTDRRRNLCQVA